MVRFRRHLWSVALAVGVVALCGPAHAASFSYQAKLTNGDGAALEGAHTIFVEVYRGGTAGAADSGTFVYSEQHAVAVEDGVVNLTVGTGSSPSGTLDEDTFVPEGPYFLEVAVDSGGNVVLPRTEINLTPRALVAEQAKSLAIQNVVTVGKTGGDFQTIGAALASITNASPTNPYLVFVGPGVYAESVTVPSGVTLKGSGRDVTTITAALNGLSVATVILASTSTLADLSVYNSGGATTTTVHSLGVLTSGSNVRIQRVSCTTTVTANNNARTYGYYLTGARDALLEDSVAQVGASSGAFDGGHAYALYALTNSTVTVRDCLLQVNTQNFQVFGAAVYLDTGSRGYLSGSRLLGNRTGLQVGSNGAQCVAEHCTIDVTQTPMSVFDFATVRIASTRFAGPNPNFISVQADVVCAGCYDEAFAFTAGPGCP